MRERFGGRLKAVAPKVEAGVCPNHQSGSAVDYPGCEVRLYHEAMPIPKGVFSVNTETADQDATGNEGVFNRYHLKSMEKQWNLYLGKPQSVMIFRSPYVEDITGKQGTGPNFEVGGGGTGESDRGIAPYYAWLRKNVGEWRYPEHVKVSEAGAK